MELIIVRHGQPENAVDGALTALGEEQAQRTAARLAEAGVKYILSSPLLRALGTASIIAERLDLPIIVWHDLREGNDKPYTGLERAALQQRFPRAKLPEEVGEAGWAHGGDTFEPFFARAGSVLNRIRQQFDDNDCVLLIGHGGLSNYLLHAILQIPATAPQWFEMAYCAVSRVRFVPATEQEQWSLYPNITVQILSLNDTNHL